MLFFKIVIIFLYLISYFLIPYFLLKRRLYFEFFPSYSLLYLIEIADPGVVVEARGQGICNTAYSSTRSRVPSLTIFRIRKRQDINIDEGITNVHILE